MDRYLGEDCVGLVVNISGNTSLRLLDLKLDFGKIQKGVLYEYVAKRK
jgi:hypothetical protein